MQQFDTDSTHPFFDQTVTLDGVNYVLAFAYNQREARYYVSLGTPAGVWLATGCAVVCDIPLFANATHYAGTPAGRLFVLSSTSDDSPPQLGQMGVGLRCSLNYVTAADLAG